MAVAQPDEQLVRYANRCLAMSEEERNMRVGRLFRTLCELYMGAGLSFEEAGEEAGGVVADVVEDLILLKHERVVN